MKQYRIRKKERIAKLSKIRYDRWVEKNKKDNEEYMKKYRREWEKYHPNYMKKYKKQYRIDNKEKIAKYKKQYRKDNAEKIKEYDKQRYIKDRDKILKKQRKYKRKVVKSVKLTIPIYEEKGVDYFFDDYVTNYNKKHITNYNDKSYNWILLRTDIIIRDNFTCQMCKQHFRYNLSALTVHHIIPRKDNGSDDPRNLITLCKHCHDIAELNSLSYRQIIDYRKTCINYR